MTVDAPVTVDTALLSKVVMEAMQQQNAVMQSFAKLLAEQNKKIDKIIEENSRVLAELAARPAPKTAPRPDSFSVEVHNSDGETSRMTIRTPKQH